MTYTFEHFELDLIQEKFFISGEAVHIRPQTFQVLRLLLEHAPNLLSQETLLKDVWKREAVSTSAVAQTIREIRSLLNDSAQSPRFVQTVHRRGYRFIAKVNLKNTPDASPVENPTQVHSKSWLWVFFLPLIGLIVWQLQPESKTQSINQTTLNEQIQSHLKRGHFKQLHPLLTMQIELGQAKTRPVLSLLDYWLQHYQTLQVQLILDQISEVSPDWLETPEFILIQSRLAERSFQFEAQRAWAQQALEQFPNHPLSIELHLQLAQANIHLGQLDEASSLLDACQNQYPSDTAQSQILIKQAQLANYQSDFILSKNLLDQAESLLTTDSSNQVVHQFMLEKLKMLYETADFQTGLALSQSFLIEPDLDQNPYTMSLAYRYQSLMLSGLNQFEEALIAVKTNIQLLKQTDNRAALAGSLSNQAYIFIRLKQLEQAKISFQDALAVFTETGDKKGEALAWSNLAALANRMGQIDQARESGQKALEIYSELGAEGDVARVAYNLGLAEIHSGDLSLARQYIQKADHFFATSGQSQLHALMLSTLSQIDRYEGRLESAISNARRALQLAQAGQYTNRAAAAGHHLAQAYRLKGEFSLAKTAFEQSMVDAESARHNSWKLASKLGLAQIYLDEGQGALALQAARLTLPHWSQTDDRSDKIKNLLVMAQAAISISDEAQADKMLIEAKALLNSEINPRLHLWAAYLENTLKSPEQTNHTEWILKRLDSTPYFEIARKLNE